MDKQRNVAVIGGGASGMTAAIFAARGGARVTLFEGGARLGRKLAQTGNGRCNFTNTSQEPIFYHSDQIDFPWRVIQSFPLPDVIRFFLELGVYSKNRKGYLYPASDQAESVVFVLKTEMERLGVDVILHTKCTSIRQTKKGFLIEADAQQKTLSLFFDRVILCCGGKAFPVSGSDGSGYTLATSLGHRIIPPVPALVSLQCKDAYFADLAGVRSDGSVTIYEQKKDGRWDLLAADKGELQFTKNGLSGIPVFQVSRFAAKALKEKKKVKADVNLMPGFSKELLLTFLQDRARSRPDKPVRDFLIGLFNKKLCHVLTGMARLPGSKKAKELTKKELERLCHMILHMEADVADTGGFDRAQVCAGGVDTTQIHPATMGSRLVPGLYFAGELLDVDGMCGGYNLHFAWASGAIAGKEAAHASDQSA